LQQLSSIISLRKPISAATTLIVNLYAKTTAAIATIAAVKAADTCKLVAAPTVPPPAVEDEELIDVEVAAVQYEETKPVCGQ